MGRLILVLFLNFIIGFYCLAETKTEYYELSFLESKNFSRDIEIALQNRQFSEAVKMIDSSLAASKGDRDYLLYLKGLSLYYSKSYADAIKPCDEVIVEHSKSPWYRKSVFLKAQCLIQLKKFEEAERIYSEEAQRLLSSSRKEEIAGVYFKFAEALSHKPGKDELDAPPPNYGKAYELYKKALELEIGDDLKDEIMFRLGRMMQLAGNYDQSINDYHEYLGNFDSDWMGPVDSPGKQKAQVKNGKHNYEVRYYLAECQLHLEQLQWSRINLEDLLRLMPTTAEYDKLSRNSKYLLVKTYRIPQPKSNDELNLGVKAARAFISDYPNDYRSFSLSYEICQSYDAMGRSDDAIKSYRAFLETRITNLENDSEENSQVILERHEQMRMSATYRIAEILFSQKDYTGAIEVWNQYTAQFPNGPQWAEAQRGIVNAEFQKGVDLLAKEKYDDMVNIWNRFLEKYPLDERSRQIMFTYGQLHYHKEEYKTAISEWESLVSKYPNTEESSLALFRTGNIYEEKLMDFEKALESYRKLTWGSWAGEAQKRVQAMTEKKLDLLTERIFRTNEKALVKLTVRNIEKLTINIYKLDMESYWRKMHRITGIEDLDIALISPDQTMEYPVPDYRKYQLFEQYIEIPIDGAGVCAVNMSEDDLEATTLVIRSDVDAIIKTSKREILVFAQDMVKSQPATGAKVLVSDGAKVISEGATDKDGVFLKKLDALKDTSSVTAFVAKDGSIASDLLDISGLGLSAGLSPRGYIYTDRTAYRPGQRVYIKGIIRDISNGSYSTSPEAVYEVSVTDSQGRLLRSESLQLSKFGTFNTYMLLDNNAPVGQYQITARLKDDESKVFSGLFQVEKYQLEKIKLDIEFPRNVYFRGEKVEATFIASYYYGQPVINRPIRYQLPDGRKYTEYTDSEGKVKIVFDTTPMQPGTVLTFTGNIEGENIPAVTRNVFLADVEFSIKVSTIDVAISGEPYDVNIVTLGADGKPYRGDLVLSVYKQTEQPSHPILSQVPWFAADTGTAEVKVSEHKVSTDEKTGKGSVRLSLSEGGKYILRATGIDRWNQPVSGESTMLVSDSADEVKLRIFSDSTKFKVGETARIRIHSRLGKEALALLTYEGEGIISYRVLRLNNDWNEVDLQITHEYFPNFYVSVSAMSLESKKNIFATSGKHFEVERQLVISLRVPEINSPGTEAEVDITAVDQSGKPVESEISLALVEEALFALYPDASDMVSIFNEGIQRDAAMKTISTCMFRYQPVTRRVVKELLEEAKRLELAAVEEKAGIEARMELQELSYGDRSEELYTNGAIAAPAAMSAGRSRGGASVSDKDMKLVAKKMVLAEDELAVGYGFEPGGEKPRQELPDAGFWIPSIVTDASGKAKAKIVMPEKITQWRITTRGCTVETLVGQVTANTITRKEFFIEAKLPPILTEGDSIRVLARVHNLSDFSDNAELSLKISIDGSETFGKKQVNIKKNETTEVVFDGIAISAGREARFEIVARAGDLSDGISRIVPIRPYGIEYADSKSGVSSGDEIIFLQLSENQKYTGKTLNISIGQSINRLILDLAMESKRERSINASIIPIPGDSGSDLLATAYALGYIKQAGSIADSKQVMEYARGLISKIVLSQQDDGGWNWFGIAKTAESDTYISSRTLWALAEARNQGLNVNPVVIDKATAFLNGAFARVEQNNDDIKSVILHALSAVDGADFAYANRLYRNRNEMSNSALAYTSLIFANLKRNEIGSEVLSILTAKKTMPDVEMAALALLALESIDASSPLIKQYVDYLVSKRGFYGFSSRAKGPVVAALAQYYGKTQFAKSDYRLEILINGEKAAEYKIIGDQPANFIPVPAKLIKDGKNTVEFRLEGRGTYAYTAVLSGFSSEIKDPLSWEKPYVEYRKYYHAPLEYQGRQIANSTSEITQLPDGERTNVTVNIREAYSGRYLIVNEYLPSGTMLVSNSLSGNYQHYEIGDGMITLYYLPDKIINDYSYQLVGYSPGSYKILPTVIRDVMRPGEMRFGESAMIEVLAPGEKSRDEYKMNDSELYELGKAYFDDGKYPDSLTLLSKLYERNQNFNQREVARMLLWIYTDQAFFVKNLEQKTGAINAKKVIEYFEILRERFPELYIPFDKIPTVGRAYRDIEEFERAYLVYKATIDASFVNDSNASAVLQDEGQFLSSVDFQEGIWREYPDTPQVISSYFALSQAIYSKIPELDQIISSDRFFSEKKSSEGKNITKADLLKKVALMLNQFLVLYPEDPLADDASFSMANALLDLEDFPKVVAVCRSAQKLYPDSNYLTSLQYVEALGLFWQRKYEEAVKLAKIVADGKSDDRDLSRYIIGQIYHAQGKPELAIEWYQKVRDIYPDANESISYFEQKRLSMDEVKIFRPEENTKFSIKYRNIKEATFQVYKVDLMKLYLREKDLSKISQIHLAGIKPELSMSVSLGDGKDYVDKEHEIQAFLQKSLSKKPDDKEKPYEEGAYLVICRGDDLFSSGLILVTSLDMEVQEDTASGRIRVNVRDVVSNTYREGVHVKVIGSADGVFKSGKTDLRGIFIADDVSGVATVIARDDKDRYAFYRGKQWLGAQAGAKSKYGQQIEQFKADYRSNINLMNQGIQSQNMIEFDQMRRGVQKGVQVQKAY